LVGRSVWGDQQLPVFIFGPPPYLRNEWSYEVEIWYTGRHLKVLYLNAKTCSLEGAWEDQQPPLLFWDPLYISETNGTRKLKFGVLVCFYEY